MESPKWFHTGCLASLLLLIVWLVSWEMWVAPLRPGGSLLALKALLLLNNLFIFTLPKTIMRTYYFLLIIFFASPFTASAQLPDISGSTTEQQLEAITEGNDDNETEDDSFLQQMQH